MFKKQIQSYVPMNEQEVQDQKVILNYIKLLLVCQRFRLTLWICFFRCVDGCAAANMMKKKIRPTVIPKGVFLSYAFCQHVKFDRFYEIEILFIRIFGIHKDGV